MGLTICPVLEEAGWLQGLDALLGWCNSRALLATHTCHWFDHSALGLE